MLLTLLSNLEFYIFVGTKELLMRLNKTSVFNCMLFQAFHIMMSLLVQCVRIDNTV